MLAKQLNRINLEPTVKQVGSPVLERIAKRRQVVSLTRSKEAGASSWRLRQAVEILHYDESFSRVSSSLHPLPPLRVLSRVFIHSLLLFRSALFVNFSLEGVCIVCVCFYSATSDVVLEGRIGIELRWNLIAIVVWQECQNFIRKISRRYFRNNF